MKYGIINFTKITDGSILASNRIAKFIYNALNQNKKKAYIIDDKYKAEEQRVYDALIIINGNFGFCNFRKEVISLCENNNKIYVWVGNDYAIKIPTQLGFIKKELFYWNAYDIKNDIKKIDNCYKYVNWNFITYNPKFKTPEKKFGGLMYYGAYRKNREKYFKKYFKDIKNYQLYISASSHNAKKEFSKLDEKINFFECKGSGFFNRIGLFENALYVEDEHTHNRYCSPANRFYEYMTAGCFIIFDYNCKKTFDIYGLDISEYQVSNQKEIVSLIQHRAELYPKQKKYFKQFLEKDKTLKTNFVMALYSINNKYICESSIPDLEYKITTNKQKELF